MLRDTLVQDRTLFSRYDSNTMNKLCLPDGIMAHTLITQATKVVNNCRLTKFEALLCLIVYKDAARNKLKAIQKCEAEFTATRQNPLDVVFKPLWDEVVKIKSQSDKASSIVV